MSIDYKQTGKIEFKPLIDAPILDVNGLEIGSFSDLLINQSELTINALLIKVNDIVETTSYTPDLISVDYRQVLQFSPEQISLSVSKDELHFQEYKDKGKGRLHAKELLTFDVFDSDEMLIGDVIGVMVEQGKVSLRVAGMIFDDYLERFDADFAMDFLFTSDRVMDFNILEQQVVLNQNEERIKANLILQTDDYYELIRSFDDLTVLDAPLHLDYNL